MRFIFADAGYWIALLIRADELHKPAVAISKNLGKVRIVTSEMVLTELMNALADRGYSLRQAAVRLIETLGSDPNTSIVPQTSSLFGRGLRLYSEREDKSWSQTDCCSFAIMDESGITEALTSDRHFVQAGFRALLA